MASCAGSRARLRAAGPFLLLAVVLAGHAHAADALRSRALFDEGFEGRSAGWDDLPSYTLVNAAAECHGGNRCLLGEVKKPNTAKVLRRTMTLRADQLYTFELWARADRHSTLTLSRKNGKGERTVVATWLNVRTGWQRFRVRFSVETDGPWTLSIAAPSSHGARPGRMWLDDIAFSAEPLLATTKLGGPGTDDLPDLVRAPDGELYASWLSYRNGDTVQVARVRLDGTGLRVEEPRQLAGGEGASLLDPRLVPGGDGPWLVWSQEGKRGFDVFARRVDVGGGGEPVQVTRDPATDVEPAAAWHDGALWVAFESNRGGHRGVWLTRVVNGAAEPPRLLSPKGIDAYAPAVAAPAKGPLVVAWHAFVGGTYDVFVQRQDGSAPFQVSHSPDFDRDVQLTAAGDAVLIAWECARYQGYRVGTATSKRIVAGVLRGGAVFQPSAMEDTVLARAAEAPRLAAEPTGALWVTARVPRDLNSGWDAVAFRFAAKGREGPWVLSRREGMSHAVPLAPVTGGAVALFQSSPRPDVFDSVKESEAAQSDVLATRLLVGAARLPKLVRLKEPQAALAATELRRTHGEDRRAPPVEVNGQTYQLLFGDLHEHSDLSRCHRADDDSQDQTFEMMRDVVRYDFGALTDHDWSTTAYRWHHQAKVTRANDDPGRFTAFLGQEWTSSFERPAPGYPHGFYGHRNIVYEDPAQPRWVNAHEGLQPADQWAQLRDAGISFVAIPHQIADRGNVPVDLSRHDPAAEPVLELYQQRGSYECKGCPKQSEAVVVDAPFVQDLWAQGKVVGVIASPEHGGGAGKAAVYARSRSRADILEALRARRTYATTAARIFLEVRVAGAFMGEQVKVDPGAPVVVQVKVDAPQPIRSIEVLRGRAVVKRFTPESRTAAVRFEDRRGVDAPTWYYVRVTQKNDEMAWSSPVWLAPR